MPAICPQCDNRHFVNKEALLQHMKSSSAPHPFCSICDRRFSSQMALDAHMADKHPPTYDCLVCNRSFPAQFKLESHYRGSAAHPNCVQCGQGFKDLAACEEHVSSFHPSRSPEEKTAPVLSQTQMTDTGLHSAALSPSITRSDSLVQAPVGGGGNERASTPDLRLELMYSSPLTEVKPLFSPVTPNSLPRPADIMERLWTSRENITASQISLSPVHTAPALLLPTPPQSAHKADFNSRLYPGSVRQALRLQNDTFGRGRFHTSRNEEPPSQSRLVRYRGPVGRSEGLSWSQIIRQDNEPRSISSYSHGSLFSEMLTSPASSTLINSPGSHNPESEIKPSNALDTVARVHETVYTVTPGSQCSSPRSPEVTSPIGLGVLPTLSPLLATPIDENGSDIPEARKPLPDSPATGSPVDIHSTLSTESSKRFTVISPQDSLDATAEVTSPVNPVANPNPLHCRVCLANECDDITASMCGHLFCNRCITDAVIRTNRCPVCMTPTLLYCLFRLDLAA